MTEDRPILTFDELRKQIADWKALLKPDGKYSRNGEPNVDDPEDSHFREEEILYDCLRAIAANPTAPEVPEIAAAAAEMQADPRCRWYS